MLKKAMDVMESNATKTVTEGQRSAFTKEITFPVEFACILRV